MQRSAMRELAFQMIYGLEMQKEEENPEQVDIFVESNEITDEKAIQYLKNIQKGLVENGETIHTLIENNLKEN